MYRDRLEIVVMRVLKYYVIAFDANNKVAKKLLNLIHEEDNPP